MAAAAIVAVGPREWISPDEQLKRLNQSSPVQNDRYTRAYTAWHTALTKMEELPDQIPALPENIHEILQQACPIRRNDLKPDGTPYKIYETHSLYLIPPGSLNDLERRVNAIGWKCLKADEEEHPLKFSYSLYEARRVHCSIPIDKPEWVLVTNDILPESRSKSYEQHEQMVRTLSETASATYEIPSVRTAAMFYFLHKMGTGKSVLEISNDGDRPVSTLTHVQESTGGKHLALGCSTSYGIELNNNFINPEKIGVIASRSL